METRGKEKQAPQNAINRNTSAGKWPLSGTGAVDILKTNHHVMIAADLFATTGFQKFYQEWILNMPYGKEKKLFIPSIDVKDIPVPAAYCGMQILQYNDCDDYRTLFRHIMDSGTWLFLTENERKFPYNKGNNKNISESIKNMSFAFRYGKQGEEHGAREYFGLWRFVWSHLGNNLKQAFYYTFQHKQAFSTPEKRRDARYWQKKVSELEQELMNPYDKESLRIYPRTFKRFSGIKTIRCTKCGIDHPVFYYKYPDKKICNSCLGKPTPTHFVCKSCGKSFYYDFGTLFKYERLVETKNFHMPTHCPYCRSDKRKCTCCGKLVPAYRLNEKGMCFDCAKKERERIVKRYFCKCGREIILTQGEVDFYMNKFGKLPQRCKQCRDNRRSGY